MDSKSERNLDGLKIAYLPKFEVVLRFFDHISRYQSSLKKDTRVDAEIPR